jgi:phage host-nuclease inhibitor protein Gam
MSDNEEKIKRIEQQAEDKARQDQETSDGGRQFADLQQQMGDLRAEMNSERKHHAETQSKLTDKTREFREKSSS